MMAGSAAAAVLWEVQLPLKRAQVLNIWVDSLDANLLCLANWCTEREWLPWLTGNWLHWLRWSVFGDLWEGKSTPRHRVHNSLKCTSLPVYSTEYHNSTDDWYRPTGRDALSLKTMTLILRYGNKCRTNDSTITALVEYFFWGRGPERVFKTFFPPFFFESPLLKKRRRSCMVAVSVRTIQKLHTTIRMSGVSYKSSTSWIQTTRNRTEQQLQEQQPTLEILYRPEAPAELRHLVPVCWFEKIVWILGSRNEQFWLRNLQNWNCWLLEY